MSYLTQYVTLPDDSTNHIIGDGQRTECGIPIPYGSDWTDERSGPLEGKVCSACKKNAGLADEAQAEIDASHEAEVLASAPPVEAPAPTPDAETVAAPTPKAKAKSGDKPA